MPGLEDVAVADFSVYDLPVRAVLVPVYRYTGNSNFRRSVLGCIEADLSNQRLILQNFLRSTRLTLTRFCIVPNSIFAAFAVFSILNISQDSTHFSDLSCKLIFAEISLTSGSYR